MVGTITAKWWVHQNKAGTASKKKNHLKFRIRDKEADIDVSFFGDEANAFCGEIGSSLLLLNTTVTEYGRYAVLSGNVGLHKINPGNDEMKELRGLHFQSEDNIIHMPP